MKRKLLSPCNNCIEILELSKQIKNSNIKELQDLQSQINLPNFTKNQLKTIRSRLSEPSAIFQNVLIQSCFEFPFDPNLLMKLINIYKNQKEIPLIISYLVLLSYLSWSIFFYSTDESISISILLKTINFISQKQQQNETLICDLAISSFFHAFTLFIDKKRGPEDLTDLISPLNDYFLFNKNLPDSTFILLSRLAVIVINQNTEPQTLLEANFYGIVNNLIQFQINLPTDVFIKILERSYFSLRRLDSCVLTFFEHSTNFLDDEVFLQFLPIFPLALLESIEKMDIITKVPQFNEKEFITERPVFLRVNYQPETQSTFDEEPTPQHIEFPPQIPLESMVHKKQIIILKGIINILKRKQTLITKFIEDYGPFLTMSQKSDHCYDFFATFFFIFLNLNDIKITPINESKFQSSIIINKVLFHPSITVFSLNSENKDEYSKISTLRTASINFFLKFSEKVQIKKIFIDIVSMPILFAETVHRLLLFQIDFSNTSYINVITSSLLEPMLFYRSWNDYDKKSINIARNAVMSYLWIIFEKNQSDLLAFFSNTHFFRFILPLLFEDPLRPKILHYLSIFLTNGQNIKNEITNEIIATLMFIISNVDDEFSSKKSVELMTSIFEIANIVLQKVPSFAKTFEPLSTLFCTQISRIPKYKDCLPLLKVALKFFHYTTNVRMLKFDEMLSLEKGIQNICGDEPDDEVAELLVELFSNQNEISKPSLVYLYLQSFLHSPKLDNCLFKLINFCFLNLENCFLLHDGEIDLLILKYIDNWRVDNSISLSILKHSLQLIEIISSHICSYEIVRKFISLLSPLEGRYFPYYNSSIISSLHLLALNQSNFPKTYALPLVDDGKINATIPITNSYFSFCFWVLPASTVCKYKLLKLTENEITISFEIIGNLLLFSASSNDLKMTYDIDPKLQIDRWSLISCQYIEGGTFIIHLNTEQVASINMPRFLFKKQINVTINMNQSNSNFRNKKLISLFGPFVVLNSIDKHEINRMYRIGNSEFKALNNIIAGFFPILSNGSKFSIENLTSIQFHTNLTRVSIPHSFIDILLTYCKIESLIPLFAQVDMTYKDGSSVNWVLPVLIDMFQNVFRQNIESQKSFASSSGFLIISHLLRNANDKHFNFHLFLSFYHLFQKLQDPDLRTQLFVGILTNFEIWLKTTAKDHVKILHKLSKIVNKYRQMFVDSLDVKFFITVLQCLYWYEPVETNIARCLNRVRKEKLRVEKCRGYLFKIALKIASEKFNQNDLIAIIGTATNCSDIRQVSDILNFILSLIKNKCINFYPILLRLLSIFTICQTNLSFKIFQIFSNFNNFETVIDELLNEYPLYFVNKQLLLKLAKINNSCLIRFCSFVAMNAEMSNKTLLKLISIYKKNLTSNHSFLDENEIWTICLLFIKKSLKLKKEIIGYLVKSRINNFHKLFSQVNLMAGIFKEITNKSNNDINIILRLLINEMIDMANDNNNINQLRPIVIHFIFFKSQSINDALKKLFINSPFYDSQSIFEAENHNQTDNKNLKNIKQFEKFVNSYDQTQIKDFHFGLHISEEGKWLDSELAQKSLQKLKLINEVSSFLKRILLHSKNEEMKEIKFENFENLQDNFVPEKVQIIHKHVKLQNTVFSLNSYISMFNIYKERMQQSAQLWSHFWRSMTISRAPWHSSLPTESVEEIHFKRDSVFCYAFCPFKTRRNYSFDPHMHASFTRDSGNVHQAKEKMNNYLQSKNVSSINNNDMNIQPIDLLSINSMPETDIPHTRESSADNLLHTANSNKVSFECNCVHVTVKESYKSTFKILSDYITIAHSNSNVVKMIEKSSIILVLKRTFLHHQTAIEIFTNVRHSYFIDFSDTKSQLTAINALKKVLSPKIVQTTSFKQYFSEQSFTNDWRQRKISNFEYLLLLNIFSGRSFNSASQYPIAPWIISDYVSESIDLEDVNVYRDLTKAIGTINEHRLKELIENQNKLKILHNDAYLFSSGPVCPLNLFLWLIRLEPFTSLHIKVQGGRFDHAARIFYSVSDSFRVASSHNNDFRELIPEFYYSPEFLINNNKFDLGKLGNQPINDVELPKWAHNDPFEFVYTLRKAIESEYVSNHLNFWIDLIWGIKQKADENRYRSEMYADVWTNKPSIEKAGYGTAEGDERSSIEATLSQVGQIPPQLFSEAHPLRNTNNSQKSSQLKKGIEIDFAENDNTEIDQILAVNVTLCSNVVTNNINNDENFYYNKNICSRSSSDQNFLKTYMNESNTSCENLLLDDSDNDMNCSVTSDSSFIAASKSKKILKIRFSILNASGKIHTKIVQINLYLLSDYLNRKRLRRRYKSDINNSFSYDLNKNKFGSSSNNIIASPIPSFQSEIEINKSKTVKQTIFLIYSKTMKINDIQLQKKQHSSNQSLIHCFISPSSFQYSSSPSLTFRGIGVNCTNTATSNSNNNSSNNASSNNISSSNLSMNNSNNNNNSNTNSKENNSDLSSAENLRLDETTSSFMTETSIQKTENDELFFVGRDRSDIFIVKFDSTSNDNANSSTNVASSNTNNNNNNNNSNNNSASNANNNEVFECYSPKSCSMPYDVVCAASDGFWTAICGKDAVIRLYKRNSSNANGSSGVKNDDEGLGECLNSGKEPVHSIMSFCNSIVCCEVLSSFDTMVYGTKDASLMICSLSRGTVTYDISIKKIIKDLYKDRSKKKEKESTFEPNQKNLTKNNENKDSERDQNNESNESKCNETSESNESKCNEASENNESNESKCNENQAIESSENNSQINEINETDKNDQTTETNENKSNESQTTESNETESKNKKNENSINENKSEINNAMNDEVDDVIDIDNIELKKLLITPSWGFILACVDAIKKKDGKVVHLMFLFNINGNLIRTTEINLVVSCWTSWSCDKGFDFVLLSDENGKLFMFEAFYLNVSRPFYRCQRQIMSVNYIFDEKIAIAVSKEGRVFFVPYKPI